MRSTTGKRYCVYGIDSFSRPGESPEPSRYDIDSFDTLPQAIACAQRHASFARACAGGREGERVFVCDTDADAIVWSG